MIQVIVLKTKACVNQCFCRAEIKMPDSKRNRAKHPEQKEFVPLSVGQNLRLFNRLIN